MSYNEASSTPSSPTRSTEPCSYQSPSTTRVFPSPSSWIAGRWVWPWIIRRTPEDQAGVVMEGTRKTLADGVEITGEHDGKPFVLTVGNGTCSDGMSDNTYSMVSTFRYGDIDYKGCGEAAKL